MTALPECPACHRIGAWVEPEGDHCTAPIVPEAKCANIYCTVLRFEVPAETAGGAA